MRYWAAHPQSVFPARKGCRKAVTLGASFNTKRGSPDSTGEPALQGETPVTLNANALRRSCCRRCWGFFVLICTCHAFSLDKRCGGGCISRVMDKIIAADSLDIDRLNRHMKFGSSPHGISMVLTEAFFARVVYKWVEVFGKLPQIDAPESLAPVPEEDE